MMDPFRRLRAAVILLLFLLPPAGTPGAFPAQVRTKTAPFLDASERLRTLGLESEGAFALLERLTRQAGPRVTGSPAASAAVELMRQALSDLGFETWLEPITVQRWVRGEEEARVVGSLAWGDVPLTVTALGWSVPTPAFGLTAPVVEVRSFEELKAKAGTVGEAIVFFNKAMDRTSLDNFRAYGEAAQFRSRGASEAARLGAAGVIVRSATQRIDDLPHTGMVAYDAQAPKVPAAAISTEDAERLSAMLRTEPGLRVVLRLTCRNLEPVASANVVGQIRGSEKPGEIVLVGGHLDAWDLGTGAHDDGAGCVQAVEALRLIAQAGLKPKRTIRAVLFMNEEFGASGGRDYAADPRRTGERHIAAMESDRGGFLPVGFAFGGPPETVRKLRAHEDLLRACGIHWFGPGGGGADIGPLVQKGAVPLGFVPDSQRYFDVHHSGHDVLSSVHPRELELGAIVLAVMAYVVAQEGI